MTGKIFGRKKWQNFWNLVSFTLVLKVLPGKNIAEFLKNVRNFSKKTIL